MRVAAFITGVLMAAAYARLHQGIGFRMEMGKSFLLVNPREALFWISHYLLLVPGLLLVGWSTAPTWGRLWSRLGNRLAGSSRETQSGRRKLKIVLLILALVFVSWIGRALFLLDLPITNDEYTILFGAQILLEGEVMAPDIDPDYAFSMPWIFRHDGKIGSMDFPGTILLTAFSILTGLGPWLFFFLAAASGAALIVACDRLTPRNEGFHGARWAALFWILSPMVTTLSFTLHSHLVSRSFVALAFALYLHSVLGGPASGRGSLLLGLGIGVAAGLGLTARPAEVATVLLPVGLDLLYRAWRRTDRQAVPVAFAAGIGSLVGPAILIWWNLQTTGTWNVSARVLVNDSLRDPLWPSAWERLGDNLGFNLMMLAMWFLGPLILVLMVAALGSGRHVAKICAASVASQLLMALLHNSTGIRVVGPIHYSEAAVPLLVLAVLGVHQLKQVLPRLAMTGPVPGTLLGAYLVGLTIWTQIHTESLVDQALIHRAPLDAVAHLENAVVIADRPSDLWFSRPELEDVSSWVADLPHPDPYLRNPVLLAYPEADIGKLRARFPDRTFYRMTYHPEGELVRVRPLESP